ncbi:hypothetical protein AVEN_28861-1 [Araneus ventricosus]|uniref:Uncharacterized protein n=1 Tax=Araneus ventricosus TaxID=182803 RepID=A0A4Y2FHP1_ARAVE|nr:hypothetical protein AVEN_28861-1 [Araneus ventricosus]
MVRSRFRGRRVPGLKPNSTKDPPCMCAWCTLNLPSWIKRLSVGVVRKFGEEDASSGVVPVIWPLFTIMRSDPKQPSCCFKTGH